MFRCWGRHWLPVGSQIFLGGSQWWVCQMFCHLALDNFFSLYLYNQNQKPSWIGRTLTFCHSNNFPWIQTPWIYTCMKQWSQSFLQLTAVSNSTTLLTKKASMTFNCWCYFSCLPKAPGVGRAPSIGRALMVCRASRVFMPYRVCRS